LNELNQFNPDLLDKQRIVAISKSDLLDQDLMNDISKEMKDIPHLFFSSFAERGLIELKDLIWKSLNS
jgi:GTP-binding protein